MARELQPKAKDEDLSPTEAKVGPERELSGKSLVDMRALIKLTRFRIEQLRAGSRLFAYGYFEKYTLLSTGPDTPSFFDHLRAKADDELLEVVKWSLLKFADRSETSARLREYLGSVTEHNATANQQSLQAVNAFQEMSSGVTGLAASIRVEQEAANHHTGASMKLLREASWHISGQGHNQTKTSIKELLISSVRLQEKAEKHLGEHTNILKEILESSKRQETWLEKVSKARPEIKASPMTNPGLAKPGAVAGSVPPAPGGMAGSVPTAAGSGSGSHPLGPPFGTGPAYSPGSFGTPMTPSSMPTIPGSSAPAYGSPTAPATVEQMWKRQRMPDGSYQWTEVTPEV